MVSKLVPCLVELHFTYIEHTYTHMHTNACTHMHIHVVSFLCNVFVFVHFAKWLVGTSDVELISFANPKDPSIIQWKSPDVLSGSSLPLYYNITVRGPSNQIIAQNTTTNTSFAINDDLLFPCHSYELTLLPFQHISGHSELGIITQETLLPPPLPPTNVNLSVSLQPNSAWITIYFQVCRQSHA